LAVLVGYLVIYLTDMPHWEGRILVMIVLLPSINGWILWYGINPKTQMMSPDPKFAKNRGRHEVELRIVIIAFGLLMAYWMTLPLGADLIGLARGDRLIDKTNAVALHEVGGTADWFLYQSVEFSDKGHVDAYTFVFYPSRTKAGVAYDFIALPRTHIILDCHESRTEKGEKVGRAAAGCPTSRAVRKVEITKPRFVLRLDKRGIGV
jgi:hypothetical protein